MKTKTCHLNTSSGFTLLELLVVIAIMGILTAISLPRYVEYKQRAFDARAWEDLRNVATAEEAYFLDFEHYLSCADITCTELPGIARISKGVTLAMTGDDTNFTGESSHPQGSGKVFMWDSELGGLQE